MSRLLQFETTEALVGEGRAVARALVDEAIHPATAAAVLRWCRVDRGSGLEADAARLVAALLDDPGAARGATAADWLTWCVEAAPVADDSRLAERAASAAASIATVRAESGVAAAGQLLDACFRASAIIESRLVVQAVDELEGMVAARYRPGAGVDGSFTVQTALASALLSAFEITGRLPYSMLAEELVQTARRTLWDDDAGGFFEAPDAAEKSFGANCEAASVLARLATLHDLAEYRRAAVLASDAGYARLARVTLASQSPRWRAQGAAAARYGFAVAALVEPFGAS